MMNATASLSRVEVKARLVELGWSQNGLARRIRKDPGLVSRVLRGQATSAIVWGRIERLLARQAEMKAGDGPGRAGKGLKRPPETVTP